MQAWWADDNFKKNKLFKNFWLVVYVICFSDTLKHYEVRWDDKTQSNEKQLF